MKFFSNLCGVNYGEKHKRAVYDPSLVNERIKEVDIDPNTPPETKSSKKIGISHPVILRGPAKLS